MIYVVAGTGSLVYECASEAEAARVASLDGNAGMFLSRVAAERYADNVHEPATPTPAGAAHALSAAAALLGKRGGSVTSETKSAASRANGRKGGRPRKSQK